MGVASHLGIRPSDYDALIRTFIPHYEDMLAAAADAIKTLSRRAPVVLDLGIGSGALASRCLAATPGARVIGIDSDAAMVAQAQERLGRRLTTKAGDFLTMPLPACDAITASFALHHTPTSRAKAALYRRCFRALRKGGVLVSADCCPASDARLQAHDRAAWRAHLQRAYGPRRSEGFLRAWAREDVYVPLEQEVELLRSAGFQVDVPWRQDSFAVIVGSKAARRGRRKA